MPQRAELMECIRVSELVGRLEKVSTRLASLTIDDFQTLLAGVLPEVYVARPALPTEAPPGCAAKREELARRAEAGEDLFVRGDDDGEAIDRGSLLVQGANSSHAVGPTLALKPSDDAFVGLPSMRGTYAAKGRSPRIARLLGQEHSNPPQG